MSILYGLRHDSETWGLATAEEFDPGPRLCCYILAVYEDDPQHPLREPPGGEKEINGGHVLNGLLKAAGWFLDAECDILKELVEKYPDYTLTFTGHSLGSGVAAMLTLLEVLHRDKLGNIDRRRIRCYTVAPARCMSLNLAVRYADVINSVVLQESSYPFHKYGK
ncbi:ALPHA/BETA-HYDROLASES SUPERFAMILY PROTEIN [Salix purpurea]|uniref:ALPHA/BETA-HYDROLASES SUPERFAMILY PROTEIN n=1 Tax=Salix purpurea TaxID=77065 RepID=A0A9Q0W637_SALPP|nr:ALPHA/BETA-HYDROLASES SUPERFAMILY PROTEIN [Salix purpurea]